MIGRQHLQIPGPTMMPEAVRIALGRQAVDYGDPEVRMVADRIFAELKTMFATSGEVVVYTSSGHGGWEGVIANLTQPGDRVLVPETGTFGMAWSGMAADLGLDIVALAMDQRRAIPPEAIREALADDNDHQIKAVFAVHTETATGVTSDLRAIREAIDSAGHPALLVADSIAAFATTPLPMDDWGVDVVITGSQKGLMGPPGLSPVGIGPRALAAAKTQARPMSYWSWHNRLEPEGYRRFCGTPPMHLLFALDAGITRILDEGFDQVLARHARLAGAVRAAVEVWSSTGGMEFNALEPSERADAITCVRFAEGVDSIPFREQLRTEQNLIVGSVMGEIEGRGFRIGHMGDLNEPTILGSLAGLELGFARSGIAHAPGGVTAAISHLAANPPAA